ncbi:MAG: PQQ-dependent sugar dehydrogenase [Gemmatimonadetes bacterium]|nr:PQQ-dependent sugar dehydrogenase [Gemmatimonadota bacterium]
MIRPLPRKQRARASAPGIRRHTAVKRGDTRGWRPVRPVRRPVAAAALGLCAALIGCGDGPVAEDEPDSPALRVELVADGLQALTHLTSPPSDPRLFVVEQRGRIRIIDAGGTLRTTPFLDITDRVCCCGERGLLSVAFHPGYASNGWFYLNYTDAQGDTRVERYTVSSDANLADRASAKLILRVEQPFANHNGGLNLFGPDRMLYIGMGDGGNANDPQGHGQNRGTLLGALLRIDVDGGDPYRIPPDNPFVATAGARGEIWALGLRNPWRFAFDRQAAHLYIADVGQNQWEEVNRASAGQGGLNYGWNVMEGAHCFRATTCNQVGLTLPIAEYGHSAQACSITGGHVYRGAAIPSLAGQYFYGDYCGGWVRSLRVRSGNDVEIHEWELGSLGNITSFGEDARGELYILTEGGRIYRLVSGA